MRVFGDSSQALVSILVFQASAGREGVEEREKVVVQAPRFKLQGDGSAMFLLRVIYLGQLF